MYARNVAFTGPRSKKNKQKKHISKYITCSTQMNWYDYFYDISATCHSTSFNKENNIDCILIHQRQMHLSNTSIDKFCRSNTLEYLPISINQQQHEICQCIIFWKD